MLFALGLAHVLSIGGSSDLAVASSGGRLARRGGREAAGEGEIRVEEWVVQREWAKGGHCLCRWVECEVIVDAATLCGARS